MCGNLPHKMSHRQPRSELVSRRALYMVVKPPAEPLSQIMALPRIDLSRDAALTHMTILPFVDLEEWDTEFIPVLCRVLDGFEANVFDVCFDRIVERRAVTLRFRKQQAGARLL